MIGSLRLLIVEENEDEALRIVHHLQRSHFGVDARRAGTPGELTRQLAEQEWDIVIAGLGLDHFDGLEAIRLVRSRSLTLPVIVVSSTLDPETRLEARKEGADECVLREETARLIPLIERLLREAERLRASLAAPLP